MKKQIIFKGSIKAVTEEINELATKYNGWTVERFLWVASLKKRINERLKQDKF